MHVDITFPFEILLDHNYIEHLMYTTEIKVERGQQCFGMGSTREWQEREKKNYDGKFKHKSYLRTDVSPKDIART